MGSSSATGSARQPLAVTTCRAASTRVELGFELFLELRGVVELRLSGAQLQAGADVGQTGGAHVRAGTLERVRGALEGVAVTLVEQAEDLRPQLMAHGDVLVDDLGQRLALPVVEAQEELDLGAVERIADVSVRGHVLHLALARSRSWPPSARGPRTRPRAARVW